MVLHSSLSLFSLSDSPFKNKFPVMASTLGMRLDRSSIRQLILIEVT